MDFHPKKKKKRGTSGCTPKGNCNVGCFLIHGANTIKSNAEDWPSSWLNLDNFILAKRLVFFFSLFVYFIRVIHRYIRVWRIFPFFFFTFMVESTYLINYEVYHECEKRENYFFILQEYLKLFPYIFIFIKFWK